MLVKNQKHKSAMSRPAQVNYCKNTIGKLILCFKITRGKRRNKYGMRDDFSIQRPGGVNGLRSLVALKHAEAEKEHTSGNVGVLLRTVPAWPPDKKHAMWTHVQVMH